MREKRKGPSIRPGAVFGTARDNAGFTLVEVLIASLILFSALTAGTMAYGTSVRLFRKITISAVIAGALPDIMAQVKESLMEIKNNGEASYNEDIHYSWMAREIKTSKNIRGKSEFGGIDYGAFQVLLQDVVLTVAYAADGVKKETRYAYQELVWRK